MTFYLFKESLLIVLLNVSIKSYKFIALKETDFKSHILLKINSPSLLLSQRLINIFIDCQTT